MSEKAISKSCGNLMLIIEDSSGDEGSKSDADTPATQTPAPVPADTRVPAKQHARAPASVPKSQFSDNRVTAAEKTPTPVKEHIYEDIDPTPYTSDNYKPPRFVDNNLSEPKPEAEEKKPTTCSAQTSKPPGPTDGSDVTGNYRQDKVDKSQFPVNDKIIPNKKEVLGFLQHVRFGHDMRDCHVEFHAEDGHLVLHAKDSDTLVAAKLSYFEQANAICRQRVKVSRGVREVLSREHGKVYLERICRGWTDRYIYVESDQEGDYICSIAFSEDVVYSAVRTVISEVKEERVQFSEGHIRLFGGQEWDTVIKGVSSECLVAVEICDSSKEVVIEGIGEDVGKASTRIKELLKKHVVLKPVVLQGGCGRCLLHSKMLQQELQATQAKVRLAGGSLDVLTKGDIVTLTMSGVDPEDLRACERLTDKIIEGRVDIAKISKKTKDADVSLLYKCLQSKKGKDFIAKFEKDNCVGIEVTVTDKTVHTSRSRSRSTSPEHSAGSSDDDDEDSSDDDDDAYAIKLSNVTITAKQGNVVEEKADVLVNFMIRSSLWRYGNVAKNFRKLGGNDMTQEFDDTYDGSQSVVPTQSSGRLQRQCKHVCHVVLDKWQSEDSTEELDKAMTELYDTVKGLGVVSIALPAVGTGKILKYPSMVVAQSLVDAAVKTAQGRTRLQAITFVIYDQSDVQAFIRKLKEVQGQQSRKSFLSFFGQRCREVEVPGSKRSSRKGATAKLRDRRSRKHSPRRESRDEDEEIRVVEIILYADSKDAMEKRRKEFSGAVSDTFLYQESIKVKALKQFNGDKTRRIQSQARDKNAQVRIVPADDKIYLKGEREDVLLVSNKIKDILLTESAAESDSTHRKRGDTWKPRHQKGTEPYWREMSENHTTAPYWKKFKAGAYISGLLTKHKREERCVVYEVDTRTRKMIEELVMKTWDAAHAGHGKDAVGLSHQNLSITKVERVENLDLREKYLMARTSLMRRLRETGSNKFTALDKTPGCQKGEILTTKVMHKILTNDMHAELNEHYLFHGTKAEYVANIAFKGVDIKKGKDRTMFGPGIYCAESSTKADQYSDDKGNRGTTGLKMLLVRLLMGEIFVTAQPQYYKHPPCTTCKNDTCHERTHQNYDSVVADGQWLFREFLVYDSDKCYPEYIITYDRV